MDVQLYIDQSAKDLIKTISEEVEQGDLSPEDLMLIRTAEISAENRKTVVQAIDSILDSNDQDQKPDPKPKAKLEDWQKTDYTGTLTVPQAVWRKKNIKKAD